MPGKTPLLTQHSDDLNATRQYFRRAMADGHLDAREAATLDTLLERNHIQAQRCDLAQRDGLSRARYGESARDTIREMESLSAMRLEHRLRGRTRRSA